MYSLLRRKIIEISTMKNVRVGVIGAGIIGVSTAYNVQLLCPNAEVSIIAAEFSPNTTSDGAAGFIQPYLAPGTPKEDIQRWFKSTWMHLTKIIKSADAGKAGVHFTSGYNVFKKFEPDPEWKDEVLGFRHATQYELNDLFPSFKHGWFFTSLICESERYIPFLTEKFLKNGGKLIQRRVNNFAELGDQYDVIVNCTGIGARFLANDDSVEPVRGQVMRIQAPFLKELYVYEFEDGSESYLFARQDDVTVGGTAQLGRWDTEVDPKDAQQIWERACNVIPSLKGAKIKKHWVGLRPQRSKGVRVEAETLTYGSNKIKIVHNYGHGGCGITLHWGCALDAARLVQEQLIPRTVSKL
ncbi:D-aspartate oxidase-like isoform X3 [Lytechinus variegatus]|uniref:D-aspartate oxidase-like isoform X3 n=1 Tax=Lytechinus variegatus TaxID=7654 RepID=UPI001BB123B3|nr:D-aspartate oxidase-like isoform X3 [Lytechinus variegatus]